MTSTTTDPVVLGPRRRKLDCWSERRDPYVTRHGSRVSGRVKTLRLCRRKDGGKVHSTRRPVPSSFQDTLSSRTVKWTVTAGRPPASRIRGVGRRERDRRLSKASTSTFTCRRAGVVTVSFGRSFHVAVPNFGDTPGTGKVFETGRRLPWSPLVYGERGVRGDVKRTIEVAPVKKMCGERDF